MAAKKKKAEKPQDKKGDIKIVIGAKKPKAEPGIALWAFDGEEVTAEGDRASVAYITTQDLYALGYIKRKFGK